MVQSVTFRGRTHDNIWIGDLSLVELLKNGRTDAPLGIIKSLHDKGYVMVKNGKRALTTAGRERAEALKNYENHIRSECSASTTTAAGHACAIRAVPGSYSLRT